jgi:hypothetical protein
MIRYFISYSIQTPNSFGTANCELPLTRPIRTFDDIRALTKMLRERGVSNPVILSFCRFDDDAEAGETR